MDAGEDADEAPAAERPAPLLEVVPQERVQRCTVEQIVDRVLVVPMLFMVEPQMVEQLVDILSPLDFRVAEQVVEVPKIVSTTRCSHSPPCAVDGGTAGGNADARIPFFDIAANCGDIPVPGHGGGDFLVLRYSSQTEFNSRLLRRSLTILLLVEVFKVFAQDRVHLHHSHLHLVFMIAQMSLVKGFFGLFPGSKKVRSPRRVRVRGCPPVAAHALGRLLTRVLWLMTTQASVWTMLAASGPGLPRTLFWTLLVSLGSILLVEPGHSAHPMAAAVGQLSWWACRQPRAGLQALGSAVVGAWQSMFLRSCSACSSRSPIVVGALDVDAQCTLRTGPWSSTGPVPCCGVSAPVVVQQQVPWRLCSRMPDSTVDTCSASLPGCVMDVTQFLREGGT